MDIIFYIKKKTIDSTFRVAETKLSNKLTPTTYAVPNIFYFKTEANNLDIFQTLAPPKGFPLRNA